MLCLFVWNIAPIGPPRNFNVVIVNSRTLKLTWNPPVEELQNGLIQQYVISIMTVETERVDSRTIDTSVHRLVVNNLHPFYTYNCSILAATVGNGPSAMAVTRLPEDSKSVAKTLIYRHRQRSLKDYHNNYVK